MIRALITLLAVTGLFATATNIIHAHEDTEIGGYNVVVGFLHEPAYEGEKNAASVRVTKVGPDHPAQFTPVATMIEGLQDTLQVEVTHVPSEVSRVMNLRAVHNEPGHYVADLIPTSPGHYRFRFFGMIEGEAVDAAFDSRAGGGRFDDVQAASAIQFPQPVPAARELESAVRGAQETAMQAQATIASSDDGNAAALGIVGIFLGALGIALGGGALWSTRRRD